MIPPALSRTVKNDSCKGSLECYEVTKMRRLFFKSPACLLSYHKSHSKSSSKSLCFLCGCFLYILVSGEKQGENHGTDQHGTVPDGTNHSPDVLTHIPESFTMLK